MVSKFGTSFSSGNENVDLAPYAKKTELNAVLQLRVGPQGPKG